MENFSLQKYDKRKQSLLNNIEQVKNIASKLDLKKDIYYLEQVHNQLNNDKFMLTVVGEFSRGKSTFINAMLGTSILKSKAKPTTAMITRIYQADIPEYKIVLRDSNEVKTLDEDEFKNIIAPITPDLDDPEEIEEYQKIIERINKIKMAEVGYPNKFCEAGVEIYDTPGTNDIDAAREELTYKFVPQSDAVIVLLSAKAPLADTEVEFIQSKILDEQIGKVIIVLNYKDAIGNEEEKVINYVKDKLKHFLPNAPIFLISAKEALVIRRLENQEEFKLPRIRKYESIEDTGMVEFEQYLSDFLQNDKGNVKLIKPAKRLAKKVDEIVQQTIQMKIASLDMDIDQIEIKINDLDKKMEKFKHFTSGIIVNCLEELGMQEDTMLHMVKKEIASTNITIEQQVKSYKGDLSDEEKLNSFIQRKVETNEAKLHDLIKDKQEKLITPILSKAFKKISDEEGILNKEIANAFNIEVSMFKYFDVSNPEDDDSVIVGAVLGSVGITFGAIIAMPALVVVAGIVGIGVGIAALFCGKELIKEYKEKKREQKLDKIVKNLSENLSKRETIIIENYQKGWNKQIETIEDLIREQINEKVEKLRLDLMSIRKEKLNDKTKVLERKEELKGLQYELTQFKEDALELIKE